MLKLEDIENGGNHINGNGENDQMLPIFQRLLMEKQSRPRDQRSSGSMVKDAHKNASCPNILVKCDIVEYL